MKNRKAYIVSASHISAQEPFSSMEDFAALGAGGALVYCKDPDFRPFISSMASRRMSNILKRSIALSKYVLAKAGISCPGAIVSGTGLGCVSDTESFLSNMLEDGETMLNPSKFICSTPNTIASQIAITLGCKGFNTTHVNDGFAFEGALLSSLMLLEEGEVSDLLLCAADQMTENLYGLVSRNGLWAGVPCSEGCVSFVLQSCGFGNALAVVEDVAVCRRHPQWELGRMLQNNGISWEDIDLAVTSDFPWQNSGNFGFIPENKMVATYKQYCGQWLTAAAFGLFCCVETLRRQTASGRKCRILLAGNGADTYSFTLISNYV